MSAVRCVERSGMSKPSRVIGFLDVTSARGWDPTLAFVMVRWLPWATADRWLRWATADRWPSAVAAPRHTAGRCGPTADPSD
jgi:hypothetical protein